VIGDADQAAVNSTVAGFMERLAAFLDPHFPLHAMALRGEMVGRRLTMDRWNRVAAVLASLHAVPGAFLSPEQHDARNAALSSVMVAQKMAAAGFVWKDPRHSREVAVWRSAEISDTMATHKARNTSR